ncbi:MAG: PorT family protein [Acidobacteria bacterium]|nr:PorT family protein [Acidobacteriota bacterium]
MKKLFFVLWLVATASVLTAGPFTVRAGLSRASLVSGYADKPLIGWQLSVSYEAPLSRTVSLAPELAFVRRGSAEGLPNFGTDIANRITIDCLEAPLLLRWRVGKTTAAVRPWLVGGGYAAYALEMKSKITAAGQTWTEDIAADSRRLDFGLLLKPRR